MQDPLNYSDDDKIAALRHLGELGACIGPCDDEVHVEMKPFFGGTPIGDDVIPDVVRDILTLGNVRVLDLSETAVTDASAAELGKLHSIKELWLGKLPFTDRGLESLATLSSLECLVLSGTKITDAGLSHLVAIKSLRFVQLYGVEVTQAGIDRLRQAIPNLTVESVFGLQHA